MSTDSTLEFIQSLNNPKIIDASDSSLKEAKFTVCGSFSLSSQISLIQFPPEMVEN